MTRRSRLPIRAAILPLLISGSCGTARRPRPSSGEASPEPSPAILSSTTVEGRGYPHGASGGGATMTLSSSTPPADYGHSEDSAIKVGGGSEGVRNERQYLNSLRGPQGQELRYERVGSCCAFDVPGSEFGGLLDVYEVRYEGAAAPIRLYLNMYESGELMVPAGLTAGP